ncbi:MAG: ClpXP protease specificity-enhancing factor SspB [Pseudomonadota bacterium]
MVGAGFDYARLMQKALRGLMADVLGRVAEEGLPGEHHFYIGIDTTHPGVDMADWLRERYPQEMVIVLQEWFADLAVLGDRFQVTLNFANEPHTLVVPFDAVQTFIDPSVKFGLKFDDYDAEDVAFDPEAASADKPAPPGEGDDSPDDDGPGSPGSGPADVVRLDTFRKS